MRLLSILAALTAALLLPDAAAARPAAPPVRTVVLIGGNTPHGPLVHDSQAAIPAIVRYLNTSPDVAALGRIRIKAYPDGWPTDPAALDDASTVVWYFEGLEHHPLRDPARRARFAELMARGVGLVTLHQASTLLSDDRAIDLLGWVGAARYGMVDRTVEIAAFTPVKHPVTRGVAPFAYRDEFYPSLRFQPAGVTPILSSPLHLEAAPERPATQRIVAWTFERAGGGRSFGFTGLHYLAALDQPELRKLLLNAIIWTAKLDVPANGVRSGVPRGDAGAVQTPAAKARVVERSWDTRTRFASAGNIGSEDARPQPGVPSAHRRPVGE